MTEDDLMTVEEASRALSLPAAEVRDLVERGEVAGRQTRDGMRLSRPDVERYRSHTGKAAGDVAPTRHRAGHDRRD